MTSVRLHAWERWRQDSETCSPNLTLSHSERIKEGASPSVEGRAVISLEERMLTLRDKEDFESGVFSTERGI